MIGHESQHDASTRWPARPAPCECKRQVEGALKHHARERDLSKDSLQYPSSSHLATRHSERARTSSMHPCSTWKRSNATAACALPPALTGDASAPMGAPPAMPEAPAAPASPALPHAPPAPLASSSRHALLGARAQADSPRRSAIGHSGRCRGLLAGCPTLPPMRAAPPRTAPALRLRPRQRGIFLGGLRLACRSAPPPATPPVLPRRARPRRVARQSSAAVLHAQGGALLPAASWPWPHAGTAPCLQACAGAAGGRAPSTSMATGAAHAWPGLALPGLVKSSQSASRSLRQHVCATFQPSNCVQPCCCMLTA